MINSYIRRNPNISLIELFYKLKINKVYKRHPCSLFRFLRKKGFFKQNKVKKTPYKPKVIQTDNGFEFTHFRKTKMIHPFDILCNKLNIQHKLIRPRTPRHNGKVERSHRNDVNRFYNHLSFFDFNDLLVQMKRYLYKSNRLPIQTLAWMSTIEMRNFIINNFSS